MAITAACEAMLTTRPRPEAFRKGSAAGDADDRIIYNKQTGALYYDPDGNGIAPQVQFATLDKGLKLTAGDFTVLA